MNLGASFPQEALYWAPGVEDGYGKKTFSSPIPVSVRWQDKAEEFSDKQGRIQRSRSVIYCETRMEEGGFLSLLDFDVLTTEQKSNPESLTGAYMIMRVQSSPSLNNMQTLYKALTT